MISRLTDLIVCVSVCVLVYRSKHCATCIVYTVQCGVNYAVVFRENAILTQTSIPIYVLSLCFLLNDSLVLGNTSVVSQDNCSDAVTAFVFSPKFNETCFSEFSFNSRDAIGILLIGFSKKHIDRQRLLNRVSK